jgi:aerobic carbon-monoxide dehydrogenase medium subunit
MRPASFVFFSPRKMSEAIDLLHTKEDSKALAGGQTLIPMMKLRLLNPKYVVSLAKIPELQPEISHYKEDGVETAVINSLTTHDEIYMSELLRAKFPILSRAAGVISDQQIRNRGTIGGNVAHGDSLSNLALALLVLDTKVNVEGPKGSRTIDVNDLFLDLFTTALEPSELVRNFSIRYESSRRQTFLEESQSAGTWPFASVAVSVVIDGESATRDARIALGGIGPTPLRVTKSEKFLNGRSLDEENILKASLLASEDLKPPSDMHGSSEYRKNLARVLTARALQEIAGPKNARGS